MNSPANQVDRWGAMVLQLLRQRLPRPPAVPGRVFTSPPTTDADPHAERWESDHQAANDNALQT